jgi:cytochrome b
MTTIWDLPTRVFHWLLAAAVAGMIATGKIGGDDVIVWHARLGYCVGALLMFRVVWGFVGGHWSRFESFPPSIAQAWRYWREGEPLDLRGHSPLGALSVYAMLAFLALQVASGLFAETKEDFAGPLAALVSNATVHFMTGYHKRVGQLVVIALVVLHVAAVAVYASRGRDLVSPMWHGRKPVPGATPGSRDDARTRWLALGIMSLCSLVMWAVVKLGG